MIHLSFSLALFFLSFLCQNLLHFFQKEHYSRNQKSFLQFCHTQPQDLEQIARFLGNRNFCSFQRENWVQNLSPGPSHLRPSERELLPHPPVWCDSDGAVALTHRQESGITEKVRKIANMTPQACQYQKWNQENLFLIAEIRLRVQIHGQGTDPTHQKKKQTIKNDTEKIHHF